MNSTLELPYDGRGDALLKSLTRLEGDQPYVLSYELDTVPQEQVPIGRYFELTVPAGTRFLGTQLIPKPFPVNGPPSQFLLARQPGTHQGRECRRFFIIAVKAPIPKGCRYLGGWMIAGDTTSPYALFEVVEADDDEPD